VASGGHLNYLCSVPWERRPLPCPVEAEVTFDCPDAPAELFHLGLKGSGVLELPAGAG